MGSARGKTLNLPNGSEAVCIPHTISFGLLDTNKVVYNPHTISFGLPDANEAVCIPHTVSFDLPDTSEVVYVISLDLPNPKKAVCIPHTAPFERFYPLLLFWGDLLSTTMGQCDGYHAALISFHSTPQCWGVFSFFAAQMTGRCDTHTPPPISLRLSPLLLGGILHIACAVGAVWYPHVVPILHHSPPFNGGF